MKKFLSFLFVACALCAQATDCVKMMVFSDPHVLHQSLLPSSNPSETFKSSLMLTEHSQALFDEAIRIVGEAQPDVLLIPGDLALNGDSISLQYVAEQLNQLIDSKGVRVFIVPGNHDINEPTAKSYNPEIESKGISLNRFLELYQNCGYSEAVEIAPDHISYRANLSDSLALIAINSAMDNSAGHMSAGGITEETLSWVEAQAAAAMNEGRYPIAMTHHQMLSHFDHQTMIDVDHIANMNDAVLATPTLNEVQNRLVNAGITTIFTGHMHIQSIKDVHPTDHLDEYDNPVYNTRALYDISTNCLSGYGAAIRTIIMEDGGFASLSSNELGDIPGLVYADRQELAKARLQNMANSAFAKVTNLCKSELGDDAGDKVAQELNKLMQKYMLEDYTQLFANLSQGEEYSDSEAAKNFATKCINDFSKIDTELRGNFIIKLLLMSPELNAKYESIVQTGSEMLSQMVRSIMYNCTDWGYDSSLYNRVSDFSPTIVKQYLLNKNTTTGVEDISAEMGEEQLAGAIKRLHGAELIILRDGKVYNMLGAELK